MNNCSLSDEQRKKIEENRKRALALKAKRIGSFSDNAKKCTTQFGNGIQSMMNSDSTLTDSSVPFKKNIDYQALAKNTQFPKYGFHKSFSNSNKSSSTNSTRTSLTSSTSHSQGSRIEQQFSSVEVSKDKFYGLPKNVLRGKCVLVSPHRFDVRVGYHSSLVEYFKQMSTRCYDTSSRIWSFEMKEYVKFIDGVNKFQPDVIIEPLPLIIKQTFCEAATDNDIKEIDLSSVDKRLVKTLMLFQRDGVAFAIRHGGRILLADDMGLGKTLQALCIACYYKDEWPLLIVTPSSVRFDWAQQIYKWLPSVDPQEVNVLDSGKGNVHEGLVSIISYDLMPKKIEDLKHRKFRVIIMDESHFLKNPKAIRTKAAAAISRLSKRVILLSGTPALSRPIELFTQISAVCPKMFKFHDFGLRYCAAKLLPWGWDYSGSSNLEELQIFLERKIMIRRQKSDVLEQLPDKTRQVVILSPSLVSFTKDLKQAFKIVDKSSMKGPKGRGALLQYFHETGKAKLKAVKDFVMDLIESDKKFLVFAHHREMLDCIEDAVSQRDKIKYIRIDGRTKSEHRSQLCQKFQSQEDYKIAVLSITAANAGLNLSAANLVVFAELFWNPGILVQAEDRVHRIGQKSAVSIQYLVARKTADDFVWPLIQEKLNILTKAGLSKDCFSDADTQHLISKSQNNIMDMFKHNFIEDPPTELSDGSQNSNSNQMIPAKRKRHRSSSTSSSVEDDKNKVSPRKRQVLITKFAQSCEERCSTGVTNSKIDPKGKTCDYAVGKCDDKKCDVFDNESDCELLDDGDFEDDLIVIDNEVVPQGNNCDSVTTETASAILSAEDFQAMDDLNWDQEFLE